MFDPEIFSALSQARLYAIIDTNYLQGKSVDFLVQELIAGGVDLLQLRAKNLPLAQIRNLGKAIHQITAPAHVPLIINDYPEIVLELNAEGVHVGQDDKTIAETRTILGPNKIIGKSTHSPDQAIAAMQEGANYIGFGPLFATPTKPNYSPIGLDWITMVHHQLSIPIFCIGGIKLENMNQVLKAGAQRIVVVSGILLAEKPRDYCLRLKEPLLNTSI